MRITATVFALMLASTAAHAHGDSSGSFTILGHGVISCGTWTKDQADGSLSAAGERAWLLGFLTAFNLYGPGTSDVSSATDSNGLVGWVNTYCQQHPLDKMVTAAQALVVELGQQSADQGREPHY